MLQLAAARFRKIPRNQEARAGSIPASGTMHELIGCPEPTDGNDDRIAKSTCHIRPLTCDRCQSGPGRSDTGPSTNPFDAKSPSRNKLTRQRNGRRNQGHGWNDGVNHPERGHSQQFNSPRFAQRAGQGLPGMPGGPLLKSAGDSQHPAPGYMRRQTIGPLFCDPLLDGSCD